MKTILGCAAGLILFSIMNVYWDEAYAQPKVQQENKRVQPKKDVKVIQYKPQEMESHSNSYGETE